MTETTHNTTSSEPGNLTRTIRSHEIINHLTNFRVAVDKAIHALPGVLHGVSCTGVIQASMNLTWHIEHLRGTLIEAMLRDGLDPLTLTSSSDRPVQSQPATNVFPSGVLPPYQRESQGEPSRNISMRDYLGSVIDSQLVHPRPRLSRQSVSSHTSAFLPVNHGTNTGYDQVVPERPHRSVIMSPTPFRNDLLFSQRNYGDLVIPSTSSQVVPDTQQIFVDSNDHLVVRHASSRDSNYGNPSLPP